MTEAELVQQLGLGYLYIVEQLSIAIFFCGTLSSLVVYDSSTSSIKGVFVASVVIFVFVFSFLRVAYFLARPDPPRFHRQRGFSNRAKVAMFVITVINFLLLNLTIGTEITAIFTLIRKPLILDIENPLVKIGRAHV